MNNKDIRVEALGYPPLKPVASLQSIAHLFGSSKSRCGVYLLEFSDSSIYIGQAVDVVRRFSQHRKNHNNIVGFSFIRVNKKKLDQVERDLIHKAEELDFVILNVVHATNVVGDTDLDLVVSRQEQEHWLNNPAHANGADKSPRIELPENMVKRSIVKHEKLKKYPNYDATVDLLKIYTQSCVPKPKRTEYSFWSLSCLPGTNKSTWPRLAVVNIGVMEVLVLGHFKESKDKMWGFVTVASDVLFSKGRLRTQVKFALFLPRVRMRKGEYKDAGQHQITLYADGEDNLRKLLQNKNVQNAAAHLNLRVMKKRATIYGKHHCSDLAKQCIS